MKSKKIKPIILIPAVVILILAFVCGIFQTLLNNSRFFKNSAAPSDSINKNSGTPQQLIASPSQSVTSSSPIDPNCGIQEVTDVVSGTSLSGIIENGQEIYLLKNYYRCHDVQRNDLIIYNYAGNPVPLIKIVRAVPGDKWQLHYTDLGYEITVNGKILTNSNGQNYQIPASKISMLQLYVSSYPVIPPNSYLILGNIPSGTLDSSRFGLVGLQDIIGKAIIK